MKHGLIFDLVKLLGCYLLRRGPRRFLQLSVAERHASEPPPRRIGNVLGVTEQHLSADVAVKRRQDGTGSGHAFARRDPAGWGSQ